MPTKVLTHFDPYLPENSDGLSPEGGRVVGPGLLPQKDLFRRSTADSLDIELQPNNTWTNSSFASFLCDGDLFQTPPSSISIAPESPLPLPLLLPDCFFAALTSTTTQVNLVQIIIPGNATHPDPLSRLSPASLVTILLKDCVLLPLSSDDASRLDYSLLFATFPSLAKLTIHSCDLRGTLPDTIPGTLINFALPGNNISGTIPSTLFSNYPSNTLSINIDLSHNLLTGTLGQIDLAATPALSSYSLWLSYNQLEAIDSNTIKGSLQAITSFSVRLDHNELTGGASELLYNFDLSSANLQTFDVALDYNHLIGSSPPTWNTIIGKNFPNLRHFSLTMSHNKLSGLPTALSVGFSDNMQLVNLSFSANFLAGAMSPDYLLFTSATLGPTPSSQVVTVDFSQNYALDTHSVRMNLLNLTLTSYVLFNVSSTTGSGIYNRPFFNTDAHTLKLASFVVDISNSLGWTGFSVDSLRSLNVAQLGNATVGTAFTFIASNTSIAGQLLLPSLSNRLDTQLLTVELHFDRTLLDSFVLEVDAEKYLTYVDLSNNMVITGPLPDSLFTSSAVLVTLYAHHTSFDSMYPPQLESQPATLRHLDLSYNTDILFCNTQTPWLPPYLESCRLQGTGAATCPELYPEMCTYDDNIPPAPIAPSSPLPPTCRGTPPSADFTCINGVWTSTGTVSTPTLTISTSVVIQGNLTSTSVVIQGYSTNITLYGCANNLTTVTVQLTQEEVKELKTKLIHQLISINSSDPACRSLDQVALNTQVDDQKSCKKIKVDKIATAGSLSGIFTPDSSGCNVWWIVLVSVIAGVIIVGGVVAGVIAFLWHQRKFGEKVPGAERS